MDIGKKFVALNGVLVKLDDVTSLPGGPKNIVRSRVKLLHLLLQGL